MGKNTKIYYAIAVISIIAFFLSIVIEIQKTTEQASMIDGICSAIDGLNGCNTVQSSKYGKIFGIDNPFYGMIGFTLLAVFAYFGATRKENSFKWLTIAGCVASGITALWFLYVQKFILGNYCVYCVIVDILSIGLLIMGIYLMRKITSSSQ